MTIELIKYEKEYASGVAHMWNVSASEWGGQGAIETEESIKSKEENSAFVDLTLAKLENEIIGYCKLSIDHHDEGALYIDLLNVVPEYHGKSIGKNLLLDSINKTIKHGWRRLDLFTWPGNTKAIPLYKKTGFFWEKRDDTTHLINLMPDVLSCDLVKDFFDTVDWYKDSKRVIDIEPDSRLVNGFDLWHYEWEKDDKRLYMEYSRRGRGLRKIENDDMIIEVVIDQMKLVFGDTYKVKYLITNKTDKPLDVSINGVNDKNILFDFKDTFQVRDYKEVEATFFVDQIEKKQKEKHTHPVVKSIIEVNGKEAVFMTGIEPVFPLAISFNTPNAIQKTDVEQTCYINIENECGSDATFEFTIDQTDVFALKENNFKVNLKKDEKATIKTSFLLKEATLITDKINIKTRREGKSDFEFDKEFEIQLQADYGKFSGETASELLMANGGYLVQMNKENNIIEVKNKKTNERYAILAPKLGKPFTQEFEKKVVSKVEFERKNDWIKMITTYDSEVLKNIHFKRVFKLHANGILKRWFEFTNDNNSDQEITFSDGMYLKSRGMITAYNNTFISTENESNDEPGILRSGHFDENWLFTHTKHFNYGFIWPKDYEMKILSYSYAIEHDFKLKAGQLYKTEPVVVGANAYVDWHDVREHALGKTLEREQLVLVSDVKVNEGNPFVDDTFQVTHKNHQCSESKNMTSVHLSGETFSFEGDQSTKLEANKDLEVITVDTCLDADHLSKQQAIFKKSNLQVDTATTKEDNMTIFSVDNGSVRFECAPEFSSSIHTLKYKDEEWLKSSFPTPKSFSWWKSWVGGILNKPVEITLPTLAEEKRSCQHVTKEDNLGNKWQGLEITTHIEKNEKNKGISWKQYYLTLPGVPVVSYFIEFRNQNDEYTYRKEILHELFLAAPENQTSHIQFTDKNGRTQKIMSGNYERDTFSDYMLEYHRADRQSYLTFYSDLTCSKRGYFIGTDMIGFFGLDFLNAEANESVYTKPTYLIFGQTPLQKEWLKDFNNLSF